ncbi:MAG: SBBP repeat-containing protein [Candidatus Hydrogenedentes bacterium]|nr:SBBP repeat-containing protein [Candidatus Hydrogenedentota bacterium]
MGNAIAVSASGHAYVAGSTTSVDFPVSGAPQSSNAGRSDVFVTKLTPNGDSILYSTYLGGALGDTAFGIALDPTGAIYVTGATSSTDFPVVKAFQSITGGGSDAFVAKLSPDGSSLVYSTYLGGISTDVANAIAVDSSGAAYVTGQTFSGPGPVGTPFPIVNAFQGTYRGSGDGFVTKLVDSGTVTLSFSTFFGGSAADAGRGIAVDDLGSCYITGSTDSSQAFPLKNPRQSTHGGVTDAFVAGFLPDGSDLVYSTYLGGTSTDFGTAIAVDSAGDAYVTGETSSADDPFTPSVDEGFPIGTALQSTFGGVTDAFVTKLHLTGSLLTLSYSTYLGGFAVDSGQGIAVTGSGDVIVTGITQSNDNPDTPGYDGFPLLNPIQATFGGVEDVFVARVQADATAFVYTTFLGGSFSDQGRAVAVDIFGNAYLTGATGSFESLVPPISAGFPLAGALQSTYGGDTSDGFVTKIVTLTDGTIVDSDGDGIADNIEGIADSDNDGFPNLLDLDSDSDGLPDAVEGSGDPDSDSIPNFLDDDSDGDGIPDLEGLSDPDGDLVPNYLDDDSDGDGILDLVEGVGDPDGDGIPNFVDFDSDGDGIPDATEGEGDPDSDEAPNYLDDDSDGDTRSDQVEGTGDPDGDSIPNFLDPDSDGDGLSDLDEIVSTSTDPLDADSDNDGLNDGNEVNISNSDPNNPDTDSDTLTDGEEVNTYSSDPTKEDTDGDGLKDNEEVALGTLPNDPDSDGDGISDGEETSSTGTNPINPDSDGDGLTDGQEINTYNTDPLDVDDDNDGLTDGDEVTLYLTDPKDPDTDHDGLNDGAEIALDANPNDTDSDHDSLLDGDEANNYGTSPVDTDTDNDGLTDGIEVKFVGTNPTIADTDGDGLNDGEEVTTYTTDPRDNDTDGDGLNDGAEIQRGTNPKVRDSDGDGLSDGEEVLSEGTNPLDPDSDNDGLTDGAEVQIHGSDPLAMDTDGEGLTDPQEVNVYGTNPDDPDTDGDGLTDYEELFVYDTDPLNEDTDGDGLNDGAEILAGANPHVTDSDGDGVSDGDEADYGTNPVDTDSDDDGLTDGEEAEDGTTDGREADSDHDGLEDGDERNNLGTISSKPDSDGDGMPDGFEVLYRLNPLNPADGRADADLDGLSNVEEFSLRSNPRNADSPRPTFYVSPSGADQLDHGTALLPWRTIMYAISQMGVDASHPATLAVLPGTYTENVTLQEGLHLIGIEPSVCIITGAGPGIVSGAHRAAIRNLTIQETPGSKAVGAVLMRMDNALMLVRNVVFRGDASRSAAGLAVTGEAAADSLITDCAFTSLAVGIEIAEAIPTIRRCTFEDLSGNGIVFLAAEAKSFDTFKDLGDSTDPNTGYNSFDNIDGPSVVNERPEEIPMQNNYWGSEDPSAVANEIQGPGQVEPFLKAGIIPASIVTSVWNAQSLAPVSTASIQISGAAVFVINNNTNGVYVCASIPAGNYTVGCSAQNYVTPASLAATVSNGQTAQVSYPMTPTAASSQDTDGDGLTDSDEINVYHTSELKRDTDDDGINDDVEIAYGSDPLTPNARPVADIDGNSVVDAVDVQLVINAALGLGISGDADINKDGNVDAVDVQIVINAALGLP